MFTAQPFMPSRKLLLRYSLSKITRTSGPHLVIRDSVDCWFASIRVSRARSAVWL